MRVQKTKDGWLVVLERGEEVVSSLTAFAQQQHLEGGQVRGIGGVCDVVLGWYDLPAKVYRKRKFAGNYELVSLVGNIACVGDGLFLHLHATISGPDFVVRGGHLFEAKVAITGEFEVRPAPKVVRKHDRFTGLRLLAPTTPK